MSAPARIPGNCPFKEMSGYPQQFLNTVKYFKSPDLLHFFNEKVLKGEESEEPYAAVRFPFNHRSKFAVITEEKLIAECLRTYRYDKKFCESEEFAVLAKILGAYSPLTCQDKDLHADLRKSYKESTFSIQKVNEMAASIATTATGFIAKTFHDGQTYNAPETLIEYTLSQSLKNLIKASTDISVEELAPIVKAVEKFVTNEILWKFPESFLPGKVNCIKKLEDIANRIINEESTGLLEDLKKNKDEKIVCSAAKTAIVIGSGTTRSALVSTILCLIKYPDKQNVLYNALLEKTTEVKDFELIDWTSCSALVDFVQEVLRLYPPILFLSRHTKDDSLDVLSHEGSRFTVESNSSLLLSVYHSSRNPEHWDDPNSFKPERYSDNSRKGRLFTFSEGSTKCLGQPFALSIIYSLIGPLLLKFRVEPPLDEIGDPIDQNPDIRTGMTLQFSDDIQCRMVLR